jgi:hypothetical protein
MNWHPETITTATEGVLRALQSPILSEHAYLAGGTGLALRFGHRRSVDLDLFIPEMFDEEQLLQRLKKLSGISDVRRAPRTLHVTVNDVNVSFIGYEYPVLFEPDVFDGIPVADARDIACMKITAISSRGTKRDFVDFHAACLRFGMRELLTLFGKKYAQTGYNKLHILKSLTYFADAEKDPMPHMLIPLEWQEVRLFFESQVPCLDADFRG